MFIEKYQGLKYVFFAAFCVNTLGGCAENPKAPPQQFTPEHMLVHGQLLIQKTAVERYYDNILKPFLNAYLTDGTVESRRLLSDRLAQFTGIFGNSQNAVKLLMAKFAEEGIDPAEIILPVMRDDIAGYITRLHNADGTYNQGARLKLIALWQYGFEAGNLLPSDLQFEITAALPDQPALLCVTSMEGNKIAVESYRATMEEILLGTPILKKYGMVAEKRGDFLWCLPQGGSAAKISEQSPAVRQHEESVAEFKAWHAGPALGQPA